MDAVGIKKFQMDMANAAKGHAKALQDAKADLADIVARLAPGNATALTLSIEQTLDQRSQADWMSNKLGVIA